jgi:SAM-dependent methyltransferase
MIVPTQEKALDPASQLTPTSNAWRLLLVSSAALYIEITLIRWIGTEVRIFAFFQNLSLIACFLGFGVGCFNTRQRGSLLPSLVAVTALVALVNLPFQLWRIILTTMSFALSFAPDAALWGADLKLTGSEYWMLTAFSALMLALFLLLLVIAMAPLGRWVGHYLETAPDTVTAYSVNLAGSLVGMWLLAILALLWLPPACWFALAFALILAAQPISWREGIAGGGLMLITLFALWPSGGKAIYWSPYQKLEVTDVGDSQYQIDVNNVGYMSIANVTPGFVARHPDLAQQLENSSYDSPFRFAASESRVLVIGAGAGNDAAAALRHGAADVNAVEIDPLIYSIGKRLHPEDPYGSPKVHVTINDARNFLRQNHQKYDVIVFGLLDSHTGFSGYSNVRVDNYVYTEESFRDARRLLKPDGILVLKFEVRAPWTWMGQRFYSMLGGIFGHAPVTYYVNHNGFQGGLFDGTVFLESNSPRLWEKASEPQLSEFVRTHPTAFPLTSKGAPPPATDDWPYVYHESHSIPHTYLTVSFVLLLMTFLMVRPYFKPSQDSTWQFFLLGAGFLLMETQLVSRLALYFGTTWLVNSIALSGILTVLLLSNVYVKFRPPGNLSAFYVLLCAALVANYFMPWARVPGSATAVGILLCLANCIPVFFAGIIFTESFRRRGGRSDVLGANILGAVAGGLTQNLSFILGMKALLIVAAAIYCGAALLHFAEKGRIPEFGISA